MVVLSHEHLGRIGAAHHFGGHHTSVHDLNKLDDA
jgi:hypothetical protein